MRWKDSLYQMSNLFILNETFTDGSNQEFLNFISLASILCGIFVIISKNPILSVLFLIGLFLSISGYLMMLGLNFIGLSYLLVYVGAVSILFLFILMLINVRVSELITDTSNSIPLAILIGISFNTVVYKILPFNGASINSYVFDFNQNFFDLSDINNISYSINKFFNIPKDNSEIAFVTSQIWDGSLGETSHITSIGNVIYTSYSIWLIMTSIILLLAMVGAIVITIKQRPVKFFFISLASILCGIFGNFLLSCPPRPHGFSNLAVHSSCGNFFKLLVGFLLSCLVFVSVKFPFKFFLANLGLFFLFPLVVGISSTIISFIKQCLNDNKELSVRQLWRVFNISLFRSSLSSLIIYYCLTESDFELFFVIFGGLLVDLPFKMEGLILYANSRSESGPSASPSSGGYDGDRSRPISSTIPADEQKFQWGALVPGLSYDKVYEIRNEVDTIIVNRLKHSSADPAPIAVTVSDILIKSKNSASTYKVLEKAYSLSKTKFETDSVLATTELITGPRRKIMPSPALIELRQMI